MNIIEKNKDFTIVEKNDKKILKGKDFNYVFDKINGLHYQWGRTKDENPQRCSYGPIIADIEILSMCKGPGGKICPFCYKSNTPKGKYMSLETYKTVFHKLPNTLTQIAFGADADCSLNPDLFDIMQYTRDNGLVPNITVADITEETAEKLAKVAGAVSVSWYGAHTSKDYCYNSVYRLTEAKKKSGSTLKQVNIHFMLSQETLVYVDEFINDVMNDYRLKDLNATVFLSLKQKGRGTSFKGCTVPEFKSVVDRMLENKIRFGFDSCSQPKFILSVKDHKNYKQFEEMSESCESFSQSIYINEEGVVYPCSFMEKMPWNSLDYNDSKGYDMLDPEITKENFLDKIWNSERAMCFSYEASKCGSCGRGCQVYDV